MKRIVLACMILVSIISISAQAPEGDFSLQAYHSGKCLHIDWSLFSNGASITQRECNKESGQTFRMLAAGPYFLLRSASAPKCIQLSKDSKDDGVSVTQWDCQDIPRFKWARVVAKQKNYFYIINQYSGKCLHVEDSSKDEGANIVQWDCEDPNIAQWRFVPK